MLNSGTEIGAGLNSQRMVSNIMFGMRTDSAQDPLVIEAMETGMEYRAITGSAHIYCIQTRNVLIALRTGVWIVGPLI